VPEYVPIPPLLLKRVVELAGYEIWAEDDFNWIVGRGLFEVPISLPKLGSVVPVEEMRAVFRKAEIDSATYFELLQKAYGETSTLPPTPRPE